MRLLGGSEAMPMPRWMRHVSVDRTLMDYPGTTYFVPAANFLVPARPRRISYVVIPITGGPAMDAGAAVNTFPRGPASAQDRKSVVSENRVPARVEHGGRRNIKKNNRKKKS